jgi:hypothetical protein
MLQDDRLIELLSGSLDGVLSADETSELEAAMARSPEARDLLAQLTSDKEALRTLPALQAPDNLKQRALLKARAASPAAGMPWRRFLMAASVLLLIGAGFFIFRPIAAIENRLHLHPGALARKAAQASHELSLAAAGSSQSHVMLSQAVSGNYNGGPTHLHVLGDAGNLVGGRLRVRLSFDFEGDGKFDLHSEPRELELDQTDGYQELACTWPTLEGMKSLNKGKVQVELVADSEGPPLKLKLEPDQARLDLPFDNMEFHDELATSARPHLAHNQASLNPH